MRTFPCTSRKRSICNSEDQITGMCRYITLQNLKTRSQAVARIADRTASQQKR